MAELYVVQSFNLAKGCISPDAPIQVEDAAQARRMAERLSLCKAAVIAFVREVDASAGDYSVPRLLIAIGDLPDEILELERAD
ncbi:hypothetical protein [Pseudochrobactrum kiredjianiae]|uniref:DUF982 domain-containing protein n=1 Tax=Pseudochrobactrum kiredjianiae TaxID=386305 RepID=A0ABW3UZT8_9HYPH|nr:hypothetical protein [Pseudochrobactrum kiredjianiae]MDM7852344.1 hypothetical protein [Pseudochrobactrum kiredjianiae]